MNKLLPCLSVLLVLGALFLGSTTALAQVFTPPTTTPGAIRPDTTERREVVVTPEAKKSKALADSAKRTEHMFRAFGYQGIRLTRPGKAALLSALLPGAGQIYNRSWWKLPLVYGAVGGTIGLEVFYQTRFGQFKKAIGIIERDPSMIGSPDLPKITQRYTSLEALNSGEGIVFYRGYRDIFYLYIGIAYGLQVVDALVDAHLKDFDVSDDLSLHWQPTLLAVPGRPLALPTVPGVQFALRLK